MSLHTGPCLNTLVSMEECGGGGGGGEGERERRDDEVNTTSPDF